MEDKCLINNGIKMKDIYEISDWIVGTIVIISVTICYIIKEGF